MTFVKVVSRKVLPSALFAIAMFAADTDRQDLSIFNSQKLDALHEQRLQWMMVRQAEPAQGVYRDFRAAAALDGVLPFRTQELARQAGVDILFTQREPRIHNGVLWTIAPEGLQIPTPPNIFGDMPPSQKELKRVASAFKQRPVLVAGLTGGAPLAQWLKLEPDKLPFAPVALHVLAKELTEAEVQASLAAKRTYIAHEWLADAKGFAFWASNNQGVFELGDRFPLQPRTRVEVRVPLAARLRVYRDDQLLHEEKNARGIGVPVTQPGAYRVEADLESDGRTYSWIRTSEIHIEQQRMLQLPNFLTQDPNVETMRGIAYVEGSDNAKHKLDLYLPKGKKEFPVFVFFHGGSWSSGDRSIYAPLGILFAKKGIGVAIPSYRLMPANPHPAQVDDATAAFAWVARNIAAHGGDVNRIFIGGHSAGGHLAALLALNPELQSRHNIAAGTIKGVAALSGVYDLRLLPMFGTTETRKLASPMEYVRKDAPPFLISYCQWDYLSLPMQARDLAAALKRQFVPTRLLYVPNETHISEVISMLKDGDPTTEAVLRLIETGQP
ncbi:hypothetical protein F183_A04560 [Bryobacterales bacterium F-183]|nr:hypothetical protein F183_A04560 [Bryobacterales bacterium F-183]